jgi:hypothetical protein
VSPAAIRNKEEKWRKRGIIPVSSEEHQLQVRDITLDASSQNLVGPEGFTVSPLGEERILRVRDIGAADAFFRGTDGI